MPSRAAGTAGEGSLPAAVRTVVVSDLHLGARTGADLLRRPAVRAALLAHLEGADRLVLLGDTVELRHGPVREALAAARPVLREIGQALGGELVLVPGNHDHRLLSEWLEGRGTGGRPPPLSLEERAGPDATAATAAIAEMVAPSTLDVAYPGLWLADGVYATHGHYVDRHSTVPSFERLAAGALGRVLGDRPGDVSAPDDYEIVLAPLYALLDAIAARSPDGRGPSHANASTRAWRAPPRDGGRPPRPPPGPAGVPPRGGGPEPGRGGGAPAAAPPPGHGGVPARGRGAEPGRRGPVPRRPVGSRVAARRPACDARGRGPPADQRGVGGVRPHASRRAAARRRPGRLG